MLGNLGPYLIWIVNALFYRGSGRSLKVIAICVRIVTLIHFSVLQKSRYGPTARRAECGVLICSLFRAPTSTSAIPDAIV